MTHAIHMNSLQRKSGHTIMNEAIEAQAQLIERDLELFCSKHNLDLNDPGVSFGFEWVTEPAIGVLYCLKKNGVALETWGYTIDLTDLLL
jgi:hypothetical protein